jgi:IrrE N-terminal-like domain
VASSANPSDLGPVSAALREEPGFLAGWLSATPDGERRIQESLTLSNTSLRRLLTCRAPRPQRFLADVSAIAAYVDVNPTALTAALREATFLAALGSREISVRDDAVASGPADLLAAARDTAAEHLPVSQAATGVRELADATWRAAPAEVRDRRDVQAAVVWASSVVVVSLPGLHLTNVNRWLADRGVPALTDGVGDLRGLLVAWRGQAAIFIDGTLPEADRRFTLAHEHGHLLLDYLVPRQRVLRDAPDLLDVLDGHRLPSDADRARAALARLPLGLHTHLLHRDEDGGAAQATIRAEDNASGYALELLAPWEELLDLLRARMPQAGTYPERLARAAEAVAVHFGLPPDAAEVRATAGLTALGVRPGFFDR